MKHYIPLILSLLAVSCEVIPMTEFTDRPVVCCYLSPDETPTLTVSKLIPFESDAAFSPEDVSKLKITITDATTGKDYLLTSLGEGSYRSEELVVETGHKYQLAFDYDGTAVTAETTVPAAPTGVTFSATSIEVMSFGAKAPQDGITISWNNDEGDYYIVEGKTSSTSCIRDYDDEAPSQSFKQNYTQGTDASLSSSDFNYYGTYQISVIHINYEYAVMSMGGSTTSTSLVDVKGNVEGGYGIFTGISRVTKNVKVSKSSGGGMPF